MSTDVIKEFLVALGFKVDATSEKKFQKAIEVAALKAQLLADAIEAIAKQAVDVFKKMATDVEKTAAGFEKLYYSSVRMQASAANIRDMGKAAEQLGSSADAAGGSLLSFTNTLKALPGAEGLLNGLGVSTRVHGKIRDHEQVLEDFIRKTGKMPTYLAMQYRQMFGIDEGFAQAINSGEWDKIRARTVELRKKVGLDPNQAAKDSRTFMQGLRDVGNVAQAIFERIESRYYSRFGSGVSSIADMLANNADAIIKKITPVIDKFVEWLTDPKLPAKLEAFGTQVWEAAQAIGRFVQWVASVVPGGGGSVDNGDGTTSRHSTISRDAPRSGKGSYQDPYESRDQSKPGTFFKGAYGQTLFNNDWIEEKKVDGTRATGGPVKAGKSYVVGEKGIELFTPDGDGTIIPNGGGAKTSRDNWKRLAEIFGEELSKPDGAAKKFGERVGESFLQKILPLIAGAVGLGGAVLGGSGPVSANVGGVHVSGKRGGTSRRRMKYSESDYKVADGKPGQYRPVYGLSDADLSDEVVNIIAGEATSSQTSTDAVINNMFNRLGTRAYGPSSNLRQVALAPGQYAASPNKGASASRAAFIRSRIKAIASGSVPDITGGANEYRAASYNGPWGQRHAGAPVIGGNRFAYNPKVPAGPYAAYKVPRAPGSGQLSAFGRTLSNSPSMASGDVRDSISTPPGSTISSPVSNDNRISNTIAPHTTITVNGAADVNATASAVEHAQRRVQGHLLRNVQGAAQ
ncbi:hypothetical protein [Labrys neptuniae]